jgi:hypothetical protein
MLRLVFVINAFVASAYGIAMLVAPSFMLQHKQPALAPAVS